MVQFIEVKKIIPANQHKNGRTFRHRAHSADEMHFRVICSEPKYNFTNTIDYAKKFMKIQITEEDLKEGNLDIILNILFTRKIPYLMFEYSKKLAKKMNTYTALPLMGFNFTLQKRIMQ
jgi:hypothetical protein